MVKDLDIGNVKYCGTHLKFVFFIKTKKMIFLEVTKTIIGRNTSYSVLKIVIHKESH